MSSTRNQFQVLAGMQDQEFLAREEHLKNLQDMLQTFEESIAKIECVSEESIGVWIVQVLVHKHLLRSY